jgi:tetratricopeptide (TPR) repeat protein
VTETFGQPVASSEIAAIVSAPGASYLSRLSLRQLARNQSIIAGSEAVRGAILWIDFQGFTTIVERFCREGAAGTERLSDVLNVHFGDILRTVEAFDGDLQFLAGDGALILWSAGSDEDLSGPVMIARAAALEAQRSLRARRVEGTSLAARCVLGAGSCRTFTVGGEDGRWFHLLAGDGIRQISGRSEIRPGQVILSPEALAVGLKPRGRSVEPLAPAALPDPGSVERLLLLLMQSRLQSGHLLPEVRTVSVVFADLSALGWEPDAARLQRAVSVLQPILREHDGAWYQLLQDDQGTYAVFVFGVAGTAREDDAVRAVRFSRAARQTLTSLLGEVSCGVATGPLFCGDCGTLHRRQYALFGSAMNRAARLMATRKGLLIDEATHRQAERKLVFEAGVPMVLKGMGATPVFRGGGPRRDLTADRVFVGRRTEREELTGRLTAFSQGEPMPVLTITGPPGIGKTALLADVSRICPALGLECAYSAASPFERRTPYFSLRQVALRLLGIDEDRKPDEVRGRAQHWLRQIDADPDLLPLIGPLLGHGLEETVLTSQMTGAIRAENTNTLITNLLLAASSRRRWVVALDDAQWVDAASWTLVPRLRERLPNVGWILAFREPPERAPSELVAHAESVDLRGLSRAEVTDLLRTYWQVEVVADDVIGRFAHVDGNPLFCLELAASLVKTGELLIDRGRGVLAPAASAGARTTTTPLSLAALIQSRVDRLGSGPLLLLKLASVLGLSFEQASLRELAGVASDGTETDARDYQANVDALLGDGCLQTDEAGPHGRLTFASATMQSVIYDLLPSRQQRRLHDAAGRTLEALHAADLAPFYGQLSHHFSKGENAAKAAHYSGLAAFQALDGYANDDAIYLFERALRHDASFRGSLRRDLDRARWYSGIAQANYSLTRPDAARSAYRQALRHTGHREPRGPLSPILGLIAFLVLRTWRSRRAADDGTEPTGPRAFQDLALSLAVSWGTLDVWQGRLVGAAAKAFAAYRWASRSPSSGSRAEAIGGFGYFLGITPIRRMGESELRRAVTMSDLHGDLQSQASTRVMLGMYYALMGRSKKALPVLEEAQPIAKRLGAGLWKHRTRFQLGEALLSLAQFQRATDVFQDAARLSRGAEPPIVGLANSFAGLAELRLGHVDTAVALVDGPEGAALCTDAHLPMQRFVALALQAQTQLSDGRLRESFQTACRAEAISHGSRECDVFFVAMHGHAAVATVHLALWRRSRTDSSFAAAGFDQRELRRRTVRASGRLGRFARLYPAVRPCADFFAAACLELAARHTRAAKLAARSLKESRQMTLPFDEWRALSSLGRVAAATERVEHRRDAQEIGDRLGFSGRDHEITGDFVRWTRGQT